MMKIDKKLDMLSRRFQEVEKLLSDVNVIGNADEYRKLLREHSSLVPVVEKYGEYRRVTGELGSLAELKGSDDPELQAMAAAEEGELAARRDSLESELQILLLPSDPNDERNAILEIRAGTGGEEAALFAGELFRMYARYAETKGWRVEVIDSHPTELGGMKEVIFMVAGDAVWKHLKYERGVHRVQRVPATEASGRVHTSAVSVAVLPEAEEVDIDIRPEDLRVDVYRASGAGGQHVNKTESAVRITHLPSGIVVACQDERSQIKNRARAMTVLRSKLLEKAEADRQDAEASERRQQIGSGDRSEKIRTYNYPQNRITDHRINFSTYRLAEVLEGDIQELVDNLVGADRELKLAELEHRQ